MSIFSPTRRAPHGSPGRSAATLAVIEWLGHPIPELQVVFDLKGYGEARVDTYWRDSDVVGEADGDMKYRDDPRGSHTAILVEKKREDALLTR